MPKFIGRQRELEELVGLTSKKSASFVVVRGRRRIGKSTLIEEFGKKFNYFYSFEGLAPEKGMTPQDQRDSFANELSRQLNAPQARYYDWEHALHALGERVRHGKILILFDEISWMGMDDPTFLPKIKKFWDKQLKKNDKLIFIVCGSASSWIEKNILNSTGFIGRISYILTLNQLPLPHCSQFWPEQTSAYEQFKVLAVTGGVPKYLEEIDPKLSAENNIKRLCFMPSGLLVREFEQIFSDLFLRDSVFYKKIVSLLVDGSKTRAELCLALNVESSGRVTEYLQELRLAGLISFDETWVIKTGMESKLKKYRLSDNYLRFYLKYITKNLAKIERETFILQSLASLPQWHTMMGLQFENLVLNNRALIHQALHLDPNEIVCENPYFQSSSTKHPGCQIDYMIQTKFGSLYICEIKCSKQPIDSRVIKQLQKKSEALYYPKGYSIKPVLIHINGVTQELIDANYFSAIIDFSSFLDR